MVVCPEGWHLPDITELKTLFSAVGGVATAGTMLKSTEGWHDKTDGTSGNGSDSYSFSALPAGVRYYDGDYDSEGSYANFWSSTEYDSNYRAYSLYLDYDGVSAYLYDYNGGSAYLYDYDENDGFSVRCLKDYKSSSSEKNSSSSSIVSSNSSSSSVVPTVSVASPCKTETEDNCEYGTLTDDRDGQTYKTVKIGDQVWMAENLNYRYIQQTDDGAEEDSSSYCYNDDPANCAKYGRLYLWSAAMDSAGIIPGNTANGCGYWENCNLGNVKVRGVCPEGWHLPDTTEWNALFNAVGGEETAGIMLKSTEGWEYNGNGTDSYFFSALPAGPRDDDEDIYDAFFWSSTEFNSGLASSMCLFYNFDSAYLFNNFKNSGLSVRCLKD